jgi:hypothetical protein
MDKVVSFRPYYRTERTTQLFLADGSEAFVWAPYEEVKEQFKHLTQAIAADWLEKEEPKKEEPAVKKDVGLLKRLHELAWRNDDLMSQEALGELQLLIDAELQRAERGKQVRLTRLSNGFIKKIEEIG